MRVLVVNAHYSPDSFGGATLVAEETVRGLSERGHEMFVFTGTYDPGLAPYRLFRYADQDAAVVAIHIPEGQDEYESLPVQQRFGQVLAAVRPDVVHIHALQGLGIGVAEEAVQRGVATVVTAHDAWWLCQRQFMVRETGEFCGQDAIDARVCATCVPDAARHRERQRRSLDVLNRCDRVLAPSSFWRDLMVASGVRADVAVVNGNGVSRPAPGWRRPDYDGPTRIGYVGGLTPVKGYPQLVAALQSLGRSDYVLRVVDNFANLGLSTMSEADWPVPGTVEVVRGYQPQTMDDFFGGLDVLAFPSQWKESYGLTVREAVLRGVWPVVTDGGGTADHIVDGRNGTVVPRSSGHRGLAAALAACLDTPRTLRPDRGLNDRIPSWTDQVAELEGLLREVVAGRDQNH